MPGTTFISRRKRRLAGSAVTTMAAVAMFAVTLAAAPTTTAAVLFHEDWDAETIGDDATELTQWAFQAGTASAITVQSDGTGGELQFDNGFNNQTVRTSSAYSLDGAPSFSISSVIRHLGNQHGRFGIIAVGDNGDYRFDFHTSNDNQWTVRFYRNSTEIQTISLTDLETSLGQTLTLTQDNDYRFQVTGTGSSTNLALYVNGELGFSYADTDAAHFGFSQVEVRLIAWSNADMAFDDITLEAVPEPASLALTGLGAVVMLSRRRHRAI